jgi:hypothetical protein
LNNYADGDDVLELSPDVVIVASGGLPNFGDLEGEQNCLSTWDVLGGDVEPAKRVLVYDGTGRHEALSCAEFLAARGAAVTLATIDDQVGAELGWLWRTPGAPQTTLPAERAGASGPDAEVGTQGRRFPGSHVD